MRWLTKSSALGGQEPPSAIPMSSAEHLVRHRVRRFHYHPSALGRGFFFGEEPAPTVPETTVATAGETAQVPAELSEEEKAHRAARNVMRICGATLLLALLLAVLVVLFDIKFAIFVKG
jgi:hypothetical protein